MSLAPADSRLTFHRIAETSVSPSFCEAVSLGLGRAQKSLPSRFFYDDAGSLLFERITELDEYYLTNAEQAILEEHADSILLASGGELSIVEFGSGSSRKTRVLIEAALARQGELLYAPIDISRDFLRESSHQLLEQYGGLRIHALAAEYADAIGWMPEHDGPRLILFLGSNIGNFTNDEAVAFLWSIRQHMRPNDCLLMGADLAKDSSVIERAYNDDQGVTAEFNKNILRRINRELDANFDLSGFRHHAPYLLSEQRVEMRLVSERDQFVEVEAIGESFVFAQGESILTEYCQKYTMNSLESLCALAGLSILEYWLDPNKWFSLVLLTPEDHCPS